MRLTTFGTKTILFYAIVATAYYASPYTNLFFLLVSFLSVVLTLNFWWTFQNTSKLSGRLEDITATPADSVMECAITLDSKNRVALNVIVELRIDGQKRHIIARALTVDGSTSLKGRLPKLPRGIHAVQSCRATSSYPLGLIRAGQSLVAPQQIVVYPAPLAEQLVDPRGSAAGSDASEGLVSCSGGEAETAGLREYQTGDSIRLVHWKASARNPRSLVVRELEPRADAAAEIEFDARCDGDDFERSLSAISRLALTAQQLDQPIVLHTQDLDATFGAGRRPLIELWRWLAIASPVEPDRPPPPKLGSPEGVALPAALHRLTRETQ